MEFDERFLFLVFFLDVGDDLIDSGFALEAFEIVVVVVVIIVVVLRVRLGAVFQTRGRFPFHLGQIGARRGRILRVEKGRWDRVGMGRFQVLAVGEKGEKNSIVLREYEKWSS